MPNISMAGLSGRLTIVSEWSLLDRVGLGSLVWVIEELVPDGPEAGRSAGAAAQRALSSLSGTRTGQ